MVTGGGRANALAVLNKNCFTQGIAGLIDYGDIEIARTGPNREIVIAVITGHTFGRCTIAVTPLINIRHAHAGQWCTTGIEHLPHKIFARAKVIMGNA